MTKPMTKTNQYSNWEKKAMSMSTSVVGFKPPDEKWKRMKAVYDACTEAGITAPPEVQQFFGHDDPDPAGVVIDEDDLTACGALVKYSGDSTSGYEIRVDKIPTDVKTIRFYNSW